MHPVSRPSEGRSLRPAAAARRVVLGRSHALLDIPRRRRIADSLNLVVRIENRATGRRAGSRDERQTQENGNHSNKLHAYLRFQSASESRLSSSMDWVSEKPTEVGANS